MPQALAVPIANFLFMAGVGTLAAQVIALTVATALFTVGMGAISKALGGKPKSVGASAGDAGRDVTVQGTTEYRRIIYGQVRAGGVVVFYGTSGSSNTYLWYVVAYAGHQCESVTDITIDSYVIPDADINAGTGAVSTGTVNGKVYIWKHLGTHNQTADSALTTAFPELGSNFKGTGITYAVYRLERDETVWNNGPPRALFALCKGKRLYDPRLDSTNGGSGTHRLNDATTWAWSDNSALAVHDVVTSGSVYFSTSTPLTMLGLAESSTRIDYPQLIAAANNCDENVTIPPASPTTTQKRYTCNVELSCGATYRDIMDTMLSSMIGRLSYSNGKYRIYSGMYDTPTVTLGEDDILGPVSLLTHPADEDTYNTVTGTFFDEDRNWQKLTFPTITDSGYVTDDGGEKLRQIELNATRTNYRCQRIGQVILRQSRNKLAVQFSRLSLKALSLRQWDTFQVTIPEYGWSAKTLRCTKWTLTPEGYPAIEARDELSSCYVDPSVGGYATPAAGTAPILQLERPLPPTSFTATGAYNGIQFNWTMPTLFAGKLIFELWEYTSSTPFTSATKIWEGTASGKWITKGDTTQRYYWLRSRLDDGSVSDTVPNGAGIAAKANAVPNALNATVAPSSISLDTGGSSSGTTAAAVVTASGGTPGYTYAWTWASGGASITTTSTTAASTTFSVTGMADGETRSGVARCTVTDGAAATYTVDVPVTITRQNSFTLTSGFDSYFVDPEYFYFAGYIGGYIGAISPASVAGKTISALYDSNGTSASFQLSGLGADPGAGFLTSIVANGNTLLGASASYSYSAGFATWDWSSSSFGFSTGDYAVYINHT